MVCDLRERVAALKKPPPRFAAPAGWRTVQQCAALSGFKEPTIYAWWRRGRVVGVKTGGAVRIDPNTLPQRIK